MHVRNKVKPAQPPAKNTSPDASDAAAKTYRACPRPAGYVVQLLLVALYMSTYDDKPLPDAHASWYMTTIDMQATATAARNTHLRKPAGHP
jgi:hypothetical protein